MQIDALCEAIQKTQCPVCVGLDTELSHLPEAYSPKQKSMTAITESVLRYNCDLMDAIAGVVPSVKVQAAYYEQYGAAGMGCFLETMSSAKDKGFVVIADVKRNDIGSTAQAYANAYLKNSAADFITVNAYLGFDGIQPFVEACAETGKGIFALVKTSNPTGGEFQDLDVGGKKLYEVMADKVAAWGETVKGRYGYSSVGAVVGATYPAEAEALRKRCPHTFFLVPGYGAQGAGADDIAVNFGANGLGAVVNSSRGILLAWKKEAYAGMNAPQAARQASLDMKEDILQALNRRGMQF